MLRLLGGLLLTAGTTAVGLGFSRRLGARVRVLSQICSAIEIMRGEILTKMTPIPELFQKLADELDEPVAQLFSRALEGMQSLGSRSFLRIWREAIQKSAELMLSEDEQAALGELGYVLGRYGSTEQAAILDFAKRRFEGFLEQAREQREKRGKSGVIFGLAAGLLVLILFW